MHLLGVGREILRYCMARQDFCKDLHMLIWSIHAFSATVVSVLTLFYTRSLGIAVLEVKVPISHHMGFFPVLLTQWLFNGTRISSK